MFTSLTKLNWTPARRFAADAAGTTPDMVAVLTTTGSLTRFLEQRYGVRLSLRLHGQFEDRCRADEALLLDCAPHAACLRRRVALRQRHLTTFEAESVLPLDGIPAELMHALREGRTPLGDLLFDRGLSLARSDLSIACMADPRHGGQPRWARRSVLRSSSGTRALVVECFAPEIWRQIEQRRQRR